MKVDVSLQANFSGHNRAVFSIIRATNSTGFYSAGADGKILHWDLDNEETGKLIALIPEQILCLSLDSKNSILFAGTLNGHLYQIDLNLIIKPRLMKFHKKSIYQMAICTDLLFTVAGDGILAIWDSHTLALKNSIQISPVGLRSIIISKNEKYLFIGDQLGRLFLVEKDQIPKAINIKLLANLASKKTIFCLCEQAEESLLWLGCMDAHVYRIDLKHTGVIQAINAHWYTVNSLQYEHTNNILFSASRDKSIRIWNGNDLNLLKEISLPKFQAHSHSVNSLLYLEDKHILLSAGDDHVIKAWKTEIQ